MSALSQVVPVEAAYPRPNWEVATHEGLPRPAYDDHRGLIAQLSGVPKAVLKTVLGDQLGQSAWQQLRASPAVPDRAVSDRDIVIGLIGHLSRLAANHLKSNGRVGKFIRLTVWHRDSTAATLRMRLPRLTHDASTIAQCAVSLYENMNLSPGGTRSMDLDVTAVGSTSSEADGRLALLAAFAMARA
jgi:hypothetical protein